MTSSKNVLVYVYISTHFKEMIRVARQMKKSGHYKPVVFFVTPYEGWKNHQKQCEEEAIDSACYFGLEHDTPKNSRSQRIRHFIKIIEHMPVKVMQLILKFKAIRLNTEALKKIRWVIKLAQYSWLKSLRQFEWKKVKSLISFPWLRIDVLKKLKWIFNICCRFVQKIIWKLKVIVQRLILNLLLGLPVILFPFLTPKGRSRLLLVCYKIAWSMVPALLPGISRLAVNFYNRMPLILQNFRIELLIIPEHNLFYLTQLLVYLAKKQDIPAVIVPFTIANTLEWSEAFYNDPPRSMDNFYNKVCGSVFPNWIHTYKNRQLLLPIDIILLHEMFDIVPSNPWLLNSGDVNFLAAESEAMSDYYCSAGIDKNIVRVVGALYNDELYFRLGKAEHFKNELYQRLNIRNKKPFILCGIPPDQGRYELTEFDSYEQIIRFMLASLSDYSDRYNIICNLHPRILPSTIEYIKEYPVTVFEGDIAEVIPLCSIYMAVCSATIRMAVTCAIPVINYDVYRYNYDDYTQLNGVLTVQQVDAFEETLKQLCLDEIFYEQISAAQKAQSTKWGQLDGKTGQRLIDEIDVLFS